MRYVVTGMVDEGLHMDRLLRECIDAFRGATALPLLTKPHAWPNPRKRDASLVFLGRRWKLAGW
jgi:hypothetical protein